MNVFKEAEHSLAKKSQHPRLSLGFLTSQIYYPLYAQKLWLGVSDTARAHGARAICFAGEALEEPSASFLEQANVVFDLASAKRIDGLVVWSGALGWHVGRKKMEGFIRQYAPLPTVSIETPFEIIPSVLLDEYSAIREVMRHLIQVHGYRRIAHLRGPRDHPGAQDIYQAYLEILAETGIPLDRRLVTPPGNWGQECGARMMSVLLDERKLSPPFDFDAILVCDDDLARGAMSVLQERGFRVPHDLAVVGHDNTREGRFNTPPLATVRVPYYEMGRKAAETALALLRDETVDERIIVPMQFVSRQSCGCVSPTLTQLETGEKGRTETELPFTEALMNHRDEILAGMIQDIDASAPQLPPDWAAALLEALRDEFGTGTTSQRFLSELGEILDRAVKGEEDVLLWHRLLSRLSQQLLPFLDRESWPRMNRLLQQARILLGEVSQRLQAQQALQAEKRSRNIRRLSQALMTTSDIPDLMAVLTEELPKLGIPSCYLALYDNPDMPAEWSRLLLVCKHGGSFELKPEQMRFPSPLLIPDEFFPKECACSLVLEPLYVREQQLGFLVFEPGPREGEMYELLRREISTALQRTLLLQRLQEHTQELIRYRDHLEDLVQERTAELTRINMQLHEEILQRGRVEQALRVSEEQYRLLAENMKEGIAIVQEDSLIFANSEFRAITGFSAEHIECHELAKLLRAPGFIGECSQAVKDGKASPGTPVHTEIAGRDGNSLWLEIEQIRIMWNSRPAFLLTLRNITERKLREQHLEHTRSQLEEENLSLRSSIKERYKFGPLVGKSAAMQRIYELITNAAASGMNVLLTGESGTGKELIARTIHQAGRRKSRPFVPVNCASIPKTLFEREFFGHRKGAFTGADRDSQGLFDRAHQGVLFLDEVTELSPAMQAKLLRVLQDGEYTPLGSTRHRQADVVIIAATNKDCQEEITQGRLRKDFFYRVGVIELLIPPLRERKDDLPLLIEHVLENYRRKQAEELVDRVDMTPVDQLMLPNQLLQAFYGYSWPGNVRELENVLQRYLATRDLPNILKALGKAPLAPLESFVEDFSAETSLPEFMKSVEKQVIAKALERNYFHTRRTAEKLGIPRRTLARKIAQYQLSPSN